MEYLQSQRRSHKEGAKESLGIVGFVTAAAIRIRLNRVDAMLELTMNQQQKKPPLPLIIGRYKIWRIETGYEIWGPNGPMADPYPSEREAIEAAWKLPGQLEL